MDEKVGKECTVRVPDFDERSDVLLIEVTKTLYGPRLILTSVN